MTGPRQQMCLLLVCRAPLKISVSLSGFCVEKLQLPRHWLTQPSMFISANNI